MILDDHTIKVSQSEDGDWVMLDITNADSSERYHVEGHSLSTYDWIRALEFMGCEVEQDYMPSEEPDDNIDY